MSFRCGEANEYIIIKAARKENMQTRNLSEHRRFAEK
jgi:hypothetical protein